jgi:hypothetical protein
VSHSNTIVFVAKTSQKMCNNNYKYDFCYYYPSETWKKKSGKVIVTNNTT